MSKPTPGPKLSVIAMAFLVITASHLYGQTNPTQSSPSTEIKGINPEPLAFDVVSIKENKSGDRSGTSGFRPNGIYMVNMSLTVFLYQGFQPPRVFGAPDWLQSGHYDLEAKVVESDIAAYHKASPAERDRMVQAIFEERMKLKTHKETRELPIYALVVAKNGSKLEEAQKGTPKRDPPPNALHQAGGLYWVPGQPAGERQIIGQGVAMKRLAQYLSYMTGIDRLIVDKTGLVGNYDFTLSWSLSTDSEATAPSIFTAVQEKLGLKLESTKGPVEVLVIDHIEKPSPN